MSANLNFEVIRPFDPAIATNDAAALARHTIERRNDELTFRDGQQPVIFVCRPLSREQRRVVAEQGSDFRRYDLAFRYGLMEVKNLPRENGRLDNHAPSRANPSDALTDHALDSMGLGEDDIQDVGSVVFTKSFLGLGVPLRCPLLDSSRRACLATFVHHAVQLRDSETQTAESSS